MAQTKENERLSAHVIHCVLDDPICANDCSLYTITDDAGIQYNQAVANVADEDEINIIFSLPKKESNNIYIIATEGDPALIRNVIANLEESERSKTIKPGNVLLLNSHELSERGICGVIFLPVETSSILDYLPQKLTFEGASHQFLLVTFLSPKEHKVWSQNGHDALMDYFGDTDKDLIQF